MQPNELVVTPVAKNADGSLVRPITAATFDDITAKAVTNIAVTEFDVVVSFAAPLTDAERGAAYRRARLTVDQEQRERQSKNVVAQFNAYLNNQALTAADDRAQLKLLTRAMKRLILMNVPDASDNAPGA